MAAVLNYVEKKIDVAQALINEITINKTEITALLQTIESAQTIGDEYFKTFDCLTNIHSEANYINRAHVNSIASIPPVNLPMYSLILFGVIPSLMCDTIALRPPVTMTNLYLNLYELLNLKEFAPNLKLITDIERHAFTDRYTNHADVVLFTGTHYNATKIVKNLRKDALFIYNGAGINPIVVFENSNIDAAVENTLFTKSFNSGQDCAGPDAILVEEAIAEEFIQKLTHRVNDLSVGASYHDSNVVIGPLIEQTQLTQLTKVLSQNAPYIEHGGQIDFKNNVVSPTIIVKPVEEGANYDELFAPVFFIQTFNSESFKSYFDTDHYTNFAMYVSFFGSNQYLESFVRDSVVLRNTNIIEIERGNNPYGGYGYYASYIQYKKNKVTKPILISKEIAMYCERAASDYI